jgi:hypothetical protein
VRSQLASEYSSYMQIWSRFWFLLAGACGIAILLALASRLIEDPESKRSARLSRSHWVSLPPAVGECFGV